MSEPSDTVLLYEGKHVQFVRTGRWEYATRPNTTGIVYIVAVTERNEIVLTEQYRIPVGRRVIELPAGLAGDVPGEEREGLEMAARRELLEETGYEAEEWTELTSGPPSAGITSEVVTLFRAGRLRRVAEGGGDESESIKVHLVGLPELAGWLKGKEGEGMLVDPKLFAGLYFLGR